MKDETINSLDVVALLNELPQQNLLRGQIGTVIEKYTETDFEVEFSDNGGKTIAMVLLNTENIMLLHNQLEIA
jgi:hypothetical protein